MSVNSEYVEPLLYLSAIPPGARESVIKLCSGAAPETVEAMVDQAADQHMFPPIFLGMLEILGRFTPDTIAMLWGICALVMDGLESVAADSNEVQNVVKRITHSDALAKAAFEQAGGVAGSPVGQIQRILAEYPAIENFDAEDLAKRFKDASKTHAGAYRAVEAIGKALMEVEKDERRTLDSMLDAQATSRDLVERFQLSEGGGPVSSPERDAQMARKVLAMGGLGRVIAKTHGLSSRFMRPPEQGGLLSWLRGVGRKIKQGFKPYNPKKHREEIEPIARLRLPSEVEDVRDWIAEDPSAAIQAIVEATVGAMPGLSLRHTSDGQAVEAGGPIAVMTNLAKRKGMGTDIDAAFGGGYVDAIDSEFEGGDDDDADPTNPSFYAEMEGGDGDGFAEEGGLDYGDDDFDEEGGPEFDLNQDGTISDDEISSAINAD